MAKSTRIFILLTVVALAAFVFAYCNQTTHLGDPARLSGWSLLGVCLFLFMYNGRKKLPAPPLGTSRQWLNLHLIIGILSLVIFLFHIQFRIPNGFFEVTLGLIFLSIFISGVLGIAMSRGFARRLRTHGQEVIFEQIPTLRSGLAQQADDLMLESTVNTKSQVVMDYYTSTLRPFFKTSQHFWAHLFDSRRPLVQLRHGIRDLRRYTDDSETEYLNKLEELVELKNGLDYHYALQKTLKGWLFFHIPLSIALLLLTVVHLALVLSFSGASH
jgi:uncharacterized integral membrane protein